MTNGWNHAHINLKISGFLFAQMKVDCEPFTVVFSQVGQYERSYISNHVEEKLSQGHFAVDQSKGSINWFYNLFKCQPIMK